MIQSSYTYTQSQSSCFFFQSVIHLLALCWIQKCCHDLRIQWRTGLQGCLMLWTKEDQSLPVLVVSCWVTRFSSSLKWYLLFVFGVKNYPLCFATFSPFVDPLPVNQLMVLAGVFGQAQGGRVHAVLVQHQQGMAPKGHDVMTCRYLQSYKLQMLQPHFLQVDEK